MGRTGRKGPKKKQNRREVGGLGTQVYKKTRETWFGIEQ